MKRIASILALAACALAAPCLGETVRCPPSRDVWLSAVGKEVDCNMGAARTIKLKVWQEFGIVDFDVSALKGRNVARAALYVKPAGGGKLNLNAGTDLRWLTISTVSHDWVEGKSARYAPDTRGHGATFNESSYQRANWGFEGAKVWDVILGNGNTLRFDGRMEPATDMPGWQRLRIPARLVQALVAGASHGLLVMDGSTSVGTNNRIFARESGNGPFLKVETAGADRTPPAAPTEVRLAAEPNRATPKYGAARLSLRVPSGTFAYRVRVNGKELDRWQIPFPARAGSIQSFPIVDLPSEAALEVAVAAVDAAGNVSQFVSVRGRASVKLTVPRLPPSPFKPQPGAPKPLGAAKVWAFPEVTKVDPVSGQVLLEKVRGDIRAANPVWDGASGTIRLAAAKAEIISFQLAVEGRAAGCRVAVTPLTGPGRIGTAGVRLWRNWYVRRQSEYAIPLKPGAAFDVPAADNNIAGQTLQAVTVDIHVPKTTPAGDYQGKVIVTSGPARVELPLKVKVYDVTIPDEIHFNPELNCYGGPGRAGSARFKDSFRLAHYNRCTINRVPYSQGGRVHSDWAPKVDPEGHVVDWSSFDANLGGLLDGSWFAGNPRAGVPVPTLYLPLFEGWPMDFRKHYNPGPGVPVNGKDRNAKLKHDTLAKPIDQAFDEAFKTAFRNCTADFVAHFQAKGWNRTLVELYLNNKPNWGYTMWTLDEPFEYLDWAALNFFGRLYKQGINDPEVYTPGWHRRLYEQGLAAMGRSRPTFLFRGDISRPMWQGSVSDGIIDIMYVGGAYTRLPRLLRNAKERMPTILYAYGSCNPPSRSNWESAAWCLKTFALNGDGVLPWQSLGGPSALTRGDRRGGGNALIIDAGKFGHALASFRVHALRRGAQDCELLRLLQLKNGWSREHIGLLVAQKVPLTAQFRQQFTDEAAAITFGTLTARGFCEMKEGVLQLLTQDR